jgi:hypothetical protein
MDDVSDIGRLRGEIDSGLRLRFPGLHVGFVSFGRYMGRSVLGTDYDTDLFHTEKFMRSFRTTVEYRYACPYTYLELPKGEVENTDKNPEYVPQ